MKTRSRKVPALQAAQSHGSFLTVFKVRARIRRDGQIYRRDGQAGQGVVTQYGGSARRYRTDYAANCAANGEKVLALSVRTVRFSMPAPG